MSKKLTLNEFIERSNKIHNNFYDYSKSVYINNYTEIKIICPKHGEFLQVASSHMRKFGCINCGIEKNKISLDEFKIRSNKIHNFKYDYSLVKFNTVLDKIDIICPIHGKFSQRCDQHMEGNNCINCFNENQTRSVDEFIKIANLIHNNFYDYSKVNYINAITNVIITCPAHGDFLQVPNEHTRGRGCKDCGDDKKRLTVDDFIKRSNIIHNNFYDYSKTIYNGYENKTTIICPIHGEFLQSPHSHLNGSNCRKCANGILKGETICKQFFENKYNKIFKKDRYNWLKHKKPMELDGFNEELKLAFEYNGRQHYQVIPHYINKEALELQQKRDFLKNKICVEKNIILITIKEFANFSFNNIYNNIQEGFDKFNIKLNESDKDIIKKILKDIPLPSSSVA